MKWWPMKTIPAGRRGQRTCNNHNYNNSNKNNIDRNDSKRLQSTYYRSPSKHFISTTILWGRYYSYPHSTGEETEAPRRKIICPKWHRKWQSWLLKNLIPIPETLFLTTWQYCPSLRTEMPKVPLYSICYFALQGKAPSSLVAQTLSSVWHIHSLWGHGTLGSGGI